MTLPTPPRKQWFLDRIGTTLWRIKPLCSCIVCTESYNVGYFIANEADALSAYSDELHGVDCIYFETKEERDEHESKKH